MSSIGSRSTTIVMFLGAVLGGCAGSLLLSAVMHVGPLLAQPPRLPTVTGAEEYRLVDRDGNQRAVLGLSADGEPYLAFIDREGNRRVWLGIAEESGLAVRDIDGKTRLVLSVDQAGQPSLVVRDRQHQSRIFTP